MLASGVVTPPAPSRQDAGAPAVICAWCDKELGVVRTLASGASHGLCKRHLAAWEQEVAALVPVVYPPQAEYVPPAPSVGPNLSGLTPAATYDFHGGVLARSSLWWARMKRLVPAVLRVFSFFSRSRRSDSPGAFLKHAPGRGDRLGRLLVINGGVK